jgi:predicted acetyltransferase
MGVVLFWIYFISQIQQRNFLLTQNHNSQKNSDRKITSHSNGKFSTGDAQLLLSSFDFLKKRGEQHDFSKIKQFMYDHNYCQLVRSNILEKQNLRTLVDVLYEDSRSEDEETLLLVQALAEKNNDEAISILDRGDSEALLFTKALLHANYTYNADQEANFDSAIDILERLKNQNPENSAFSYYLAIFKVYANYSEEEILEDLKFAAKGKYFDKFWTQASRSLWKQIIDKPVGYSLLASQIQAQLNYPKNNDDLFVVNNFVTMLDEEDQMALAKNMMKIGEENFNKWPHIVWDANDYSLGRYIFKKVFGEKNLPKHYMESKYYKKNNPDLKYWNALMDSNLPCPSLQMTDRIHREFLSSFPQLGL